MYGYVRRIAAIVSSVVLMAASAAAQTDPHAGHQMPAASGSGWTLMGDFTAFGQLLADSGERGSSQAGSVNWFMGMARHPVGAGAITLRSMISFEPWTIGGCGYPDLLATGEVCDEAVIHDRQHPHDFVMEIAAAYERPIGNGVRLQIYGGPAGEPALGPTAFMHRESSLTNPLAPITHHWFDSTHITYGVATVGVAGNRWKIEGSAFNGREPDQDRVGFDFAAMDSWSARIAFTPSERWAMQASGGRLNDAEAGHDGEPAEDVDRVTTSVTYRRAIASGAVWASTIALGRNVEDGTSAHAAFAETARSRRDRDTWYGRIEWVEKSAHDLAIEGDEAFAVAKVQGGYTRYFTQWKNIVAGAGLGGSLGIVPRELASTYGRRVNPGISIYVTLNPAGRDSVH